MQLDLGRGLVGLTPLREQHPTPPMRVGGTTLESTIVPAASSGYRPLRFGPPQPIALRTELAPARQGRVTLRTGLAAVVQLTDLHVTDVQNPLRFEYLDRRCRTGHRPQEPRYARRDGTRATGQLPSRRALYRPADRRRDDHRGQHGQPVRLELEWLLTILAGGVVEPSSGDPGAFEGVAGCGLDEYWQPESTTADRYKEYGFPAVPGLLSAATRPFASPGSTCRGC